MLYGENDYGSIRMFMKHIFRFMLVIVGLSVFPRKFLTLFRLSDELAASGVIPVRLFL